MMTRRLMAFLVLVPILLGQQCLEPLPSSSGDAPTMDPMPQVTLHTNRGDIVIELFTLQAQSASLFKQYVEEGYYCNTVFDTVSPDDIILGGRFKTSLVEKIVRPTIADIDNNLSRLRGRVALHTTPDETESVPAFVIYLVDSEPTEDESYTVIGRVISGLSVADEIANVETIEGTSSEELSLPLLPLVPISVSNPNLSIVDYTDPADDPEEDENGISQDCSVIEDGRPNAVAKYSNFVAPGMIVNLDGSSSIDPDGDALTYEWRQIAGTTVTINNPDQAHATYEAPDVDEDIIEFELIVRDSTGEEDTDIVSQGVLKYPRVRLTTFMGDIILIMLTKPFPEGAPVTSLNFMQYVEDGFYEGTIFHRSITDFVIQGGGFLPGMIAQTGLRDPIPN